MNNISKKESLVFDIKIGIKALQNVSAAYHGFSTMASANLPDGIIKSSIFYWSAIRYAKPFLDSKIDNKHVKYPSKGLKKISGFSQNMHNHIIEIRNTLIAHDDFNEIEPRVLTNNLMLDEGKLIIPESITISNKCIYYPKENATILSLLNQSNSCAKGIHEKLLSDIHALKNIHEKDMDSIKNAKFSKKSETLKIPPGISHLIPPDDLGKEWLDNKTPNYEEIENGYEYEYFELKESFLNGKTITLPKSENSQ